MAESLLKYFISYSRADASWIRALGLHERPPVSKGVKFWIDDREMRPGIDWRKRVINQIRHSDGAIVIVSEKILRSKAVMKTELPEIARAFGKNKVGHHNSDCFKLLLLPVGECSGKLRRKINSLFNVRQMTDLLAVASWGALEAEPELMLDGQLARLRRMIIEQFELPEVVQLRKVLPSDIVVQNESPFSSGSTTFSVAARDVELGRDVVIKSLLRENNKDYDNFVKTVKTMCRVVSHSNAVGILRSSFHSRPGFYVREYIEGKSLCDLFRDHQGCFPAAFVQAVLTAVGRLLDFALKQQVYNVCIHPRRIIIRSPMGQSRVPCIDPSDVRICLWSSAGRSHRRKGSERYESPDHVYQEELGRLGACMLMYRGSVEKDCRGYDTVLENFEMSAPQGDCPEFLWKAIKRLMATCSLLKFRDLKSGIEALAGGDLLLEVARESYSRITSEEGKSEHFFRLFYNRLLATDERISKFFEERDFPKQLSYGENPTQKKWQQQRQMLREAILLLFAYSGYRDQSEPTVLTRIRKSHQFLRPEDYDKFRDVLIKVVVEVDCDHGDVSRESLKEAWLSAIGPGLDYLAGRPNS